jgi:hypothetical protein
MQVQLCKENFLKIAATASDFEQYLTNVRGSDVNSARNESVRDDDYDGSNARPVKQYGIVPVVKKGAKLSGGAWAQPVTQRTVASASIGESCSMGFRQDFESEDGSGCIKEQDNESDSGY